MKRVLGPFDLEAAIGRGAMGVVWRGVHRRTGLEVAVKVLTTERMRRRDAIGRFREEVRAVARLTHPNIVTVYDFGRVAEEIHGVPDGSPYLVMELLRGGGLDRQRGRMQWPALRGVLLQLLEGLAHAHARGLVHRDLKPANVLLDEDLQRACITDFGLCLAEDHDPMAGARVGTPHYMAPEQVQGTWRDLGPWTDLYALGCLAFTMTSGRPPFTHASSEEVMRAQVQDPPPHLKPVMELPRGFGDWLGRLLQKEPAARFALAADAAHALRALDLEEDTLNLLSEGEPTLDWDTQVEWTRPDDETLERVSPARRNEAAPLPAEWRRPERPPGPLLHDAGLGLYGLREIPVLGRLRERDRLWRMLRQVHADGRPRAVCVQGPSGFGKSRLAEWLIERAHELGGAHSLRALHEPLPGSATGLAGMLTTRLRCQGLDAMEVRDRLRRVLPGLGMAEPEDAAALAALVRPDEEHTLRFGHPAERHHAVRRFLACEARRRPLIVWIDDAQWAYDVLSLVEQVMHAEEPLPVLFVLTAQDEALEEQPATQVQIARIAPERVRLGPLPPEDALEFIRQLLGVAPGLARRIAQRTAGNPLFAVQLVGGWVQGELLRGGPEGFDLVAGARLDLPEHLRDVWSGRMQRVLTGRPLDDTMALELAAALGVEVDREEWLAACDAAGVHPTLSLEEVLIRRRLARRVTPGWAGTWAFCHGMFREAVAHGARAASRWAEHHKAVAEILAARGAAPDRVGRHRLAAGDPGGALGPIQRAVLAKLSAGDQPGAAELLRLHGEAVTGLEEGDARVAWSHYLEGRLEHARGGYRKAEACLMQAESVARAGLLWGLCCEAQIWRADLLDRWGQRRAARRLLAEAREAAKHAQRPALLAEVALLMGRVRHGEGDPVAARGALREARKLFEAEGDQAAVARSLQVMAAVALQQGRHEEAGAWLDEALHLVAAQGHRPLVISLQVLLGDHARHGGDHDGALAHYERAVDLTAGLGIPHVVLSARMARARGRVERGDELAHDLAALDAEVAASGDRGALASLLLMQTVNAAQNGRWADYDRHLDEVRSLTRSLEHVDGDMARFAAIAGRLAAAAGHGRRARRAWRLARDQWRRLRDAANVERADAAIRQLKS